MQEQVAQLEEIEILKELAGKWNVDVTMNMPDGT